MVQLHPNYGGGIKGIKGIVPLVAPRRAVPRSPRRARSRTVLIAIPYRAAPRRAARRTDTASRRAAPRVADAIADAMRCDAAMDGLVQYTLIFGPE